MSKTNNRRIHFDMPTTKENIVIQITIRYSVGDPYSSVPENKGFWVIMTPTEIDGIFRMITAYSGLKAFHQSANRFSRKKLEAIEAEVKHQIFNGTPTDKYQQMLQKVVQEAGVTLERTELAKEQALKAIEATTIVP